MKTFGFNMMQDVKANVEIDGSYDPEQQIWVGEVGSAAGNTTISTPWGTFTFPDNNGSTISSSSCVNGQCTRDDRKD